MRARTGERLGQGWSVLKWRSCPESPSETHTRGSVEQEGEEARDGRGRGSEWGGMGLGSKDRNGRQRRGWVEREGGERETDLRWLRPDAPTEQGGWGICRTSASWRGPGSMNYKDSYIAHFPAGSSDGKKSACNAEDLAWEGLLEKGEWLPTPVFLPGESHGQKSLVGCSPWGHKKSDTTEQLTLSHCSSPWL